MISRLKTLPGQLAALLLDMFRDPIHMLQRRAQALWHRGELEPVQDRTSSIKADDLLLFCTLRNEAARIPYFLDYYRERGINHFLFVDNGSDDGFRELIEDQADISCWYTEASYRDANFGMHWLNALLNRYGREHWCVTCDPDEFLVYPHCDRRTLRELAAFLESEERRSLSCIMLDMYSDRPVQETVYRPGDNPFEIAPWYDRNGYIQEPGWLQDVFTRGGVRRRMVFRDMPQQAPALNKTPFVKWRWSYSYFLSMHQLVPGWLNAPHAGTHNSVTGCVMHFKYFHLLEEKVTEELQRGEHWNNSFEYRSYHERLDGESTIMKFDGSARYEDWRQLIPTGLMNMGHWM